MTYTHLTSRERLCIFYRKQMGESARTIGRYLARSHSSISREIKRNSHPLTDRYDDQYAQQKMTERSQIARHVKCREIEELYDYVINKLSIGWSPEIISNMLKKAYPYKQKNRVSTETIYQWVYTDARAGGSLYQSLIRKHKKRKKQPQFKGIRGAITNRVDISERPIVVDNRNRYGDWEGDTMVGHQHKGRFVTHVERKSRYLLAAQINKGTSALFAEATTNLFSSIPSQYRKTLTLDNGSENADHKGIEKSLGIKVYFAKPYASWERGTNENTNGLLRRYFPKGTNLLKVTQLALDKAVNMLNHRPRKCLNYKTPFEVFNRITGGALGV